MAFNFPGGAVVGQEYVTGAGITYVWNGYGWNVKAAIQDAPVDSKIYGRKDAAWAEVISDVTKAYVDAEVAKQVAASGDTMSGALIVTPKGSTFGNASGTLATSGVANTDANILIYNYSSVNWCGIGTDPNGTFWLRTGGSGSPIPALRIHADQVSHFTGPLNAVGVSAGGRGFSPSNVDAASFLAKDASYGGGITMIDGAYRASIWAQSANLALATGGNPPVIKLLLQNDNNHNLTGTLIASGELKARGNILRMSSDSAYLYYDGNWTLTPGHLYTAAGRVLGTNDGAFGNYLPLGGGTLTGQITTATNHSGISYGGPTGAIEVKSNAPVDPSITFHRGGSFATNFGLGSDQNFWFGGWSHGASVWRFWTTRDFNYTPLNRGGDTCTGTLHVNSTLSTSANLWIHGTVCYLGTGGHYLAWQDGWFYDFPHGPIRIQGAWAVRQGENVALADIRASATIHSDGNHYYMAGDGVWYRWRGDIGRTEPSHGLYISTVHQTQGSYAEGYYQKGGVSGGFEGARFNIQNGGPAFNFWSENSNYGAIYMGSDYRIKKEVKPLPSMWEKVKALRPVSFKLNGQGGFRADGRERWGFIAHELQDALIASVANGKKDCENEVQAPWPMAVLAPITKALQEVMERVEILEGKLNG